MAGFKEKTDFSFNPFVGPHAIETGRNIFGRDREITELYYLLSGERIVMLHSPSGAGKTSLIQAGLIPRLNKRFDVWGRARVNKSPSPNSHANVNRYILSAVLDFEQQIPAERRRTEDQLVGQLAGKTLTDYVANRPRRSSAPQNIVLFFDQFEEILTTDPLAIDAKREFFKQVGELLLDPHIWAVFAMREDYLPALDPYVEQLPTHLKNWFRIDLLRRDKAAEAIIKTAEEGGRHFAGNEPGKPAMVDTLVNDLATVKAQQLDGTFADQTGLYVEPLQLQVVCRQLWERMPSDKPTIDHTDIEKSGDVTKALGDYYAAEVKKLADGDERTERKLRDWVGGHLITPDGIRSQVRRGAASSEGLDNELIASLVNTHLVRSEQRENAIWYELAHDRLIKPVLDNNRAWSDTHLHKVQKLASLWVKDGGDELLLLGDELIKAQQWAKQNGISPEDDEGKFLAASTAKQEGIEKEKKQAKRLRHLLIIIGVVAVLALAASVLATGAYKQAKDARIDTEVQRDNAEKERKGAEEARGIAERERATAEIERRNAIAQREIAEQAKSEAEKQTAEAIAQRSKAEEASAEASSRELASQSASLLQSDPELSLILAHEAMHLSSTKQAENALWQALVRSGHLNFLKGKEVEVEKFSFSVDGKLILTTDFKSGLARVWDSATGRQLHSLEVAGEKITNATFSPDGKLVVSLSFFPSNFNGPARVWEASTGKNVSVLWNGDERVNEATFSPDSKFVVTSCSYDTRLNRFKGPVRVWEAVTGKQLSTLEVARKGYNPSKALFSPDSKLVLTYDLASTTEVWIAATGRKLSAFGVAGEGLQYAFFSPDGKLVVTHSSYGSYGLASGYRARLWEATTGKQFFVSGRESEINERVAFSPNGKLLVTVSSNGHAQVWDATTYKQLSTLGVYGERILYFTFSPNHTLIVTSGYYGGLGLTQDVGPRSVRIWEAATGKEVTAIMSERGGIYEPVFSSDGNLIVTHGPNGPAQVLDATTYKQLSTIGVAGATIARATFNPNGRQLVTCYYMGPAWDSANSSVIVWEVATGREVAAIWSGGKTIDEATFSPDGKLVITTYENGGSVNFYQISLLTKLASTEELKKVARQAIPRALTSEEREKYLHEPWSKGR